MWKKVIVIVCMWLIIFSIVFLVISMKNFLVVPSTQNLISLMIEALSIGVASSIICWNVMK